MTNDTFFAAGSRGMRENQEDSFAIIDGAATSGFEPNETVLIVADGMGGHVGGAQASQQVVEQMSRSLAQPGTAVERLRDALDQANRAVGAFAEANPQLRGMGSTVVAALIDPAGLYWISVGDSLLWLYRDGELQRLNQDHSMAAVFAGLVALGRMSAEDAATDNNRHALRSVIKGQSIAKIDQPTEPFQLQPNDLLILASDGLETLSEEAIINLLTDQLRYTPEQLTERLLNAVSAAENPDQDNTTVALYRVAESSQQPPPTVPHHDSSVTQPAQPGHPRATVDQVSQKRRFTLLILLIVLFGSLLLFDYYYAQNSNVDPLKTVAEKFVSVFSSQAAATNKLPEQVNKVEPQAGKEAAER